MHDTAQATSKPRLGLIGGLGAIAGADILHRIVKATPVRSEGEHLDISFVQHPLCENENPSSPAYSPTRRKLYVYDVLRDMEDDHRDVALAPCFVSQTFLEEITPEIGIRVVGIAEAIRDHLQGQRQLTLGILTSSYVRKTGFLDRYFGPDHQVIYPDAKTQALLDEAIYGCEGLKSHAASERAEAQILEACRYLAANSADMILPGFTDIPALLGGVIDKSPAPMLNCNQIFAEYAVRFARSQIARPFKIGIVGGVGPAATVDFMSKVIRNTPARHDQDHIKIVVEQNPQIPDRTENLIGKGKDPTVALYATCKKLEKAGADIIAIPCNTAHAYIARIQPYVSTLVVNMLTETIVGIQGTYPNARKVGLLATTGTVDSGLYKTAAAAEGLQLLVPDDAHQLLVMEAIYGETGVKAGRTDGLCRDQLQQVYTHLEDRQADVVILGCTELPLIAPEITRETQPPLLDPTDMLARRCVKLAVEANTLAP